MISCIHALDEDEMRFKKLSEYDEEIKRIDEILDNFKEYINNYTQEMGVKPTYISMKYLREELKKERDNLEFYKSTQEAFDRCDDSKKGMSVEEFIQQINHSIMVENQTLITELHNIMKLLNDLYEGIDEYYTETLERNDELVIARADAQLQLIKEIIDKVEKI